MNKVCLCQIADLISDNDLCEHFRCRALCGVKKFDGLSVRVEFVTLGNIVEAVGKRPSAALPSSLITAAYFYVRLVRLDFGSLAADALMVDQESPQTYRYR